MAIEVKFSALGALALGLGLTAGCGGDSSPATDAPGGSGGGSSAAGAGGLAGGAAGAGLGNGGAGAAGGSSGGCQPGGCSGELCGELNHDLSSDCIWREEFACYGSATCERQGDGRCGWTPTGALSECLQQANGAGPY